MAHFSFTTDQEGRVTEILKDGAPHPESVTLEQVYAVLRTYFEAAHFNIRAMPSATPASLRFHGLQAFLMTLTGVEAFTNVYFHLKADQTQRPDIMAQVEGRASVAKRLEKLIGMTFGSQIEGQELILSKISHLYGLRNTIVHPRWAPATAALGGSVPILIEGLVQNYQATFENQEFCAEAFKWCLLLVCRVGALAGARDDGGFCIYWTGQYGVSAAGLAAKLGLQGEA